MITCLYRPHKKHSPEVGVRAGTTQVDFEDDCPPLQILHRNILITMVKDTVILQSFKNEKKSETCSYLLSGIFLGTSQLAYRRPKLGRSPSPATGGSGACSPEEICKIKCDYMHFRVF